MKRFIAWACMFLWAHATPLMAQNANPNPTPGDVWTFMGPTLGAGFASLPFGTLIDLTRAPYNAVCNGTADDTAAFTKAITDAKILHGAVTVPSDKDCTTKIALDFSSSNVGLVCFPYGGQTIFPAPVPTTGCHVKWIGNTDVTAKVIKFESTVTPGLTGNFLYNVQIDCNSKAGTALSIVASTGFIGRGVSLWNCKGGNNLYMSALASQNLNMQGAWFDNLSVRNTTGNSSVGIYLTCDGKQNNTTPFCVAYNTFLNTYVIVDQVTAGSASPGIKLVGAGNNTFIGGRIFTNLTAPAIDFSIYDNGSGNDEVGAASGDVFMHVLARGPVIARGQTTFPTCNAFQSGTVATPHCTWNNVFLNGEISNGGTQTPTIEPGAQIYWSTNDGRTQNFIAVGNTEIPGILGFPSNGFLHNCQNNAIANSRSVSNNQNSPVLWLCSAQNGNIITFDASPDTYKLYTTGTTDGSTAVITGIPDTSTITVNDEVTGGGIPQPGGVKSKVLSIDGATQVTIDNNTTSANTNEAMQFAHGDRAHWQWTGSTPGQRQLELVRSIGTGGAKLPSGSTIPSAVLASPTFSGAPTGTVPGFGVQTADVTFNHDTSFDHALTGVQNTMYAGFTYRCWGNLKVSTGASGGIKVAFNGSSSGNAATSFLAMNAKAYAGTTLAANTDTTTNLGASSGPTIVANTSAITNIVFDGTMIVSQTGLWIMKIAQNADDATNTSVAQGSYAACQQTN